MQQNLKNIIFDYGGVLVDWNPHYIYDPYFGSREKADWFLNNICTPEWNILQDGGRSLEDGIAERISKFPEWEKEIRMYYGMFTTALNGENPGMYEVVRKIKEQGIHVFGLTNWSAETFPIARARYHIFNLMEDMVVSGEEKLLKPSPEIYLRAIEKFGIEPSETMFVDDNRANAEGASAVGIDGVHFLGVEHFVELLRNNYGIACL